MYNHPVSESQDQSMSFLCDAMLGGLARWLRAAGYDAEFEYGIDDCELIRRAGEGGRILLSSDGPMFERMKECTSEKLPRVAAAVLRVEEVFSGAEKLA